MSDHIPAQETINEACAASRRRSRSIPVPAPWRVTLRAPTFVSVKLAKLSSVMTPAVVRKLPYDQAGKRRVDPATSRVGGDPLHAA
jgi:hypothetical protein